MSNRETEIIVEVESVGARGDGIAMYEGERLFLPLTAPGDRLRAALGERRGEGRAARVLELLQPGARAAPVCGHFGSCGGCALQHLSEEAYGAAKMGWLVAALRQHGLPDDVVAPLRRLPPGTRRRARFAIRRPPAARAAAAVGFHARASHAVVDMRECAVLHPALFALVAPLRRLAPALWAPGKEGAATATLAESGIDLLLDLAAPPDLAALETMAAFAAAQDLARLAWRSPGEAPVPAAQHRPVRVTFAGVAIDLPSDIFLQASAGADAALTEAVLAAVGSARTVADLFAGVGTFSFALAQQARVHAVEGLTAAAGALRTATAKAGLADRITVEHRDLEARPLIPQELDRFEAIVFDPPRAGAKAQAAMLARSKVPTVVAVSCNPATFARDARLLTDGGYRLIKVQPIDSFVWSAQLELVAHFARE